jgi:hypothetical protein
MSFVNEALRQSTRGGFLTVVGTYSGQPVKVGMEIAVDWDQTPQDCVDEYSDAIAAVAERIVQKPAGEVMIWWSEYVGDKEQLLWHIDAKELPDQKSLQDGNSWLPPQDTQVTTT